MLKSVALANEFSTNSLPSTSLRMARPRSKISLFIFVSFCVERNVRPRRTASGLVGDSLFLRPERLGNGELLREHRDRNALLPLHHGHLGIDPAALVVEFEDAARIVFRRPAVHGSQ